MAVGGATGSSMTGPALSTTGVATRLLKPHYVAGVILRRGRETLQREEHDPRSYDPETGYLHFRPIGDETRECPAGRSCNLSFRRDAYLAGGGVDERFVKGAYRGEADMCLRILKATGGRLMYEPRAKVYHRAVPTGGIRSFSLARPLLFKPHGHMAMYCCLLRHVGWRKLPAALAKETFATCIVRPGRRRPYLVPIRCLSALIGFAWALITVVRGPKGIRPEHAGEPGYGQV